MNAAFLRLLLIPTAVLVGRSDEPSAGPPMTPTPVLEPVPPAATVPSRARDLPLDDPHPWSVALRWENDTFGGTDRFYTDGVSISLIRAGGDWLIPAADWLPWSSGRRSVGLDVGQIMITSGDKLMPIPDPDDRPYAGILYLGLSLHVENGNRYHGWKVAAGVVGPWSLAEQTQKEVHRLVDAAMPEGWDYQLHNEPILNLRYEHRRKYRLFGSDRGVSAEAIPTGSVMLGNLLTQVQVGSQLRIGYRIPDDFGTTLMRAMGQLPTARPRAEEGTWRGYGGYFYGGLHGNLVLHNITLDGNTWKDSPSVEKEFWVPSAEVGIAITTPRVIAGFSYVFFGREFKGQAENSAFGAFTLAYRF